MGSYVRLRRLPRIEESEPSSTRTRDRPARPPGERPGGSHVLFPASATCATGSRPIPDPKKEPSMVLLNPRSLTRPYPDARSAEVMRKTVEFFEAKGKTRLKADYHAHVWYADFLEV